MVLRKPIPEQGLKMGDVGTVIHVHRKAEAFEVEFLTLHGETVGIATVTASQVRPVLERNHARKVDASLGRLSVMVVTRSASRPELTPVISPTKVRLLGLKTPSFGMKALMKQRYSLVRPEIFTTSRARLFY